MKVTSLIKKLDKMNPEMFLNTISEVIKNPNNNIETPVLGLFKFILDNQEELKENIQDISDWFNNDCDWDRFYSNCEKSKPCDWIETDKDWVFFQKYYQESI
jgi:hypothetical protein